jgi:hypothetical protein
MGCGAGFYFLGPGWVNRRGVEWTFYETVGRRIPSEMPLVLLYDDWDRKPYENPFGSVPHDLAVRLFYLGRSASWHFGPASLPGCDQAEFVVIGRDRDLPALARLGRIEVIGQGPKVRGDRTYVAVRVMRRRDASALGSCL